MRHHEPTAISLRTPVHIRGNFLRLARYLGQKRNPEEITQALCVSTEIGIQEIHKSHAETELLIGEILAGTDVPGSLKTID